MAESPSKGRGPSQLLRGGGAAASTETPQPTATVAAESSFSPPPRQAAGSSTGKASARWAVADELDDRQKHDVGLISKHEQSEARRQQKALKKKKRTAKHGEEDGPDDDSVQDLLARFAGEEAQTGFLSVAQMKRALKLMAKHVEEADRRAAASEDSLLDVEGQLSKEAEARRHAEKLRSEAIQRIEELELGNLQFQAEREHWKQREIQLANMVRGRESHNLLDQTSRDDRVKELEGLLKEAVVKGAKLGRARADAENAKADLERRLTKAKDAARAKQRRERRRLEAALDTAERRCDRAEQRLAEYLQASADGADAVVEAHMQHLAAAAKRLANKVEEQDEIIDVLRSLLQDHKDFIRKELGTELGLPAEPPPLASKEHSLPQPSGHDQAAARANALGIAGDGEETDEDDDVSSECGDRDLLEPP